MHIKKEEISLGPVAKAFMYSYGIVFRKKNISKTLNITIYFSKQIRALTHHKIHDTRFGDPNSDIFRNGT